MPSDSRCPGLDSARSPLLVSSALLSLLLSLLNAAVLARWRLRHAVATLLVGAALVELLKASAASVYFGLELGGGETLLPLLHRFVFWVGNTANAGSVWLVALLVVFAAGTAQLGASVGRPGPWSPFRAQVATAAVCAALCGVYVGEIVLPRLAEPANGTQPADPRLDAAIAVADVLVARVVPCVVAAAAGVYLLLRPAPVAPVLQIAAPGVEVLQMEAPGVEEASREDGGIDGPNMEERGVEEVSLDSPCVEETRLATAADEEDSALAEWRQLRAELTRLCLALAGLAVGIEAPLAAVSLSHRLGTPLCGVATAVDLLVFLSYLRGGAAFLLAVGLVSKFRETARRVLCPCVPDPGYANVVPIPLDEE